MSRKYIHLSDIHFGQEKGGQIHVNNDAKERLIDDVKEFISNVEDGRADGIIISGDIAFAGKKKEYDSAFDWITKVAEAANSHPEQVLVVPGNHDIDRDAITYGSQLLINDIAKQGDTALDKCLEEESDRELLYRKFAAYRTFAAGYNCPLDREGTIIGPEKIEIAPNKFLRFYCINTAITCSDGQKEEGTLLLGQRQRVIPIEQNTEIIIIGHHPLHWLQDSEDAQKYIKARARVFISGHEHMPSHKLESIEDTHLLSIAAGATAPVRPDQTYTYCYNILEFDWSEEHNKLIVKIHPRIWNDDKKEFSSDSINFNLNECTFELNCVPPKKPIAEDAHTVKRIKELKNEIEATATPNEPEMDHTDEKVLLLRFFKELNSAERLEALSKMGVLPSSISDKITHTIEVLALKSVFSSKRTTELQDIISEILSTKSE